MHIEFDVERIETLKDKIEKMKKDLYEDDFQMSSFFEEIIEALRATQICLVNSETFNSDEEFDVNHEYDVGFAEGYEEGLREGRVETYGNVIGLLEDLKFKEEWSGEIDG